MPAVLRERVLPSGHIQLYLDIHHAGRRSQEALNLVLTGDRTKDRETRRLAEAIRDKRQHDLNQGKYDVPLRKRKDEHFFDYAATVAVSKSKKATRTSYQNAIDHLRNFHGSDGLVFSQINTDYLLSFQKYLWTHVAKSSAATYFFKIKSILLQAVRDGIIPSCPHVGVKASTQKRLPKYLRLDEIQKLANTEISNWNIRNAFLFSCFSGLRYSDLVRLRWIMIRDGQLTFRQQKTDEPLVIDLGKEALRILELQKNIGPSEKTTRTHPADTVFFLPRYSTIDKALKKWAHDAGFDRTISMHVARHSFGTLGISSHIDLLTLSKLMGHTSIQTTMIYAQVTDELRRNAVQQLPTLDQQS